MARRKRRKNHGRRSDAGGVAWDWLSHRIPAHQVRLERIRGRWPGLVPAAVAERTWPAEIVAGELYLNVHDNQWLHELTYLRQDILERVRTGCPEARIESIRVRLGAIPSHRGASSRPALPEPGRDRLPPEPSDETLGALEDVSDPELRGLIAGARVALSK